MTDTPQPPAQAAAPAPAAGGLAPHRGTLVLILGIMGLVMNCCMIPGILAWVFGKKDLAEMAAGRMDPSGQGLTNAGKICGMIGTILAIVIIIIYIILLAVGAATFTFNAG